MSAAAGASGASHPRRASDPAQPWRETGPWRVAQRVDHPEVEEANRLLHLDLAGGADALTLVAASSPWSRGFGLNAPADLAPHLSDLPLDAIALRLDAGADAPAWVDALSAVAKETGVAINVDLGIDPIALAARRLLSSSREIGELIDHCRAIGLSGRALMADGRVWHEAGATPAQELGLVLATATAHWRTLVAGGLPLDAARRTVAVLLAFDAEVLEGMAKARAVRRLWARLENVCGLLPEPLRFHAETSWRMMARRDVSSNAMRAIAAVFAAGLGGADAVTVLPQTLVCGLPDAAARRLARNTSRVMLDEAHLDACNDVAAGSGVLEAATDRLCLDAWACFQTIEGAGGIEACLIDGGVKRALAASAAARRRTFDHLDRGLVGTSRFASLHDPAPTVLAVAPRPPREHDDALPSSRDAEPFERLRDEAEPLAAIGCRPRVLLAPLGPPAAWGARAAAAVNLLAAAGIAASDPEAVEPHAEPSLIVGALVCLVGDDAAYAALGASAAAAFEAAGAARLYALDGTVAGATRLPTTGEDTIPLLEAMIGLHEAPRPGTRSEERRPAG